MTTQPTTTAPVVTDVRVLVAAVIGAIASLAIPWAALAVLATLVTALRMLGRAPRRRRLLWAAVAVCALSLTLMTAITVAFWAAGT